MDIIKKVAVIGSGYWGKNLVRVFNKLGCLKTVCDINEETANNIHKQCNDVDITDDYNNVLVDNEIDGVVICLPAELHFSVTRQALLAGKDVFVEKPLALKQSEAETLIQIAEDNKKILMVGHLLRYHPAFIKIKEMVDQGELGQLRYLYSNRLNFGKIRTEENILWSFAPHDISMMLALVGQNPESIYTEGGYYLNKHIADVTVTSFSFSNNIKAHIFVSWLHPYKKQELVVVGDKGMAVFDDTKELGQKLLVYRHEIRLENGVPVANKKLAEAIEIDDSEPLINEATHFLECIENRKNPITGGNEGLAVVKVLEASQRSLGKNEIVMIKDE